VEQVLAELDARIKAREEEKRLKQEQEYRDWIKKERE
jgi:hypothetical protein